MMNEQTILLPITDRNITKLASLTSRETLTFLHLLGVESIYQDGIQKVFLTTGIRSEVCEKLGLDKPAFSKIIKSLDSKGVIKNADGVIKFTIDYRIERESNDGYGETIDITVSSRKVEDKILITKGSLHSEK